MLKAIKTTFVAEKRVFSGENAENGIADFSRTCKRLHARGGPSNPHIGDKRAPEIMFNPLITILAPKLIEIRYILKSGHNETFCVE